MNSAGGTEVTFLRSKSAMLHSLRIVEPAVASPPAIDLARVTVVIPAHNEVQSLPKVLNDLPRVGRIIVVDNASTDPTPEVACVLGADVVHEPVRGYGSACLAGLRRVHEIIGAGCTPPAVVVLLDADYSDYPEELQMLVQPILSGEADFVLGSRLLGLRESGAMPLQAVWGNRLACRLMRLFWGAEYTDLGPFRAITWEALSRLQMRDKDYGWTIEMQIKAHLAGLRTQEIPVRYRRRIGVSKISGTISGTIRAGCKILYTIARFRVRSRDWSRSAS
jgi:glycosyltransferase involved in cell wall biosynthesis